MGTQINLSTDQENTIQRLILTCEKINTIKGRTIDFTDTNQVENKLNDLLDMFANTDQMMHDAKLIHEEAKGASVDLILADSRVFNSKQDIQRKFLEGKLARFSALYERVETCCKDLRNTVEGLRSLLSFEKEQMRNQVLENARR